MGALRYWFLLSPLLCLLFSVCWTWPAAISHELVGRHSDTLTTIWFLDAAPRLPADPLSGMGESYQRLDSLVLWMIAHFFRWDPVVLHRGLQLFGVALTAWATERAAAGLGARAPWSLLAGFSFVSCGLASSALMEGYVYPLLNPWLPLVAWALCQPRAKAGFWAALGILAALGSNGYLGACALLMLGTMGLFQWRTAAVAALCSAPGLWLYLQQLGEAPTPGPSGPSTSANLLSLSIPTEALDRVDHSLLAVHPWTLLALAVAAPVVLRRRPWWPLALASGVAFLLSTGPDLAFHGAKLLLRWPWAGLYELDSLRFLRFPVRLGWVSVLGTALLGAQVASELASRLNHRQWTMLGLWICLGVDLFVIVRQPFRQREQWAAVPSVYAQVRGGMILDLVPEVRGEGEDLGRHFRALICYYQTGHRRPIPERCLGVEPGSSPRERLGAEVLDALLRSQPLPELPGIQGLIWHPDLFRPGDRERLRLALEGVDPKPLSSRDGGEFLLLYDRRSPAP